MGCGEARGALLGCRHVVLYAVVLFGALGVVEAIERAYQVAGDAADALEGLVVSVLGATALGADVLDNAVVAAHRVAVDRVVHRAVAHAAVLHVADDAFEGLQVVGWVAVELDVADVAAVGERVVGRFQGNLVEGGDVEVHRHVEAVGVVVAIGHAGDDAVTLAVDAHEATGQALGRRGDERVVHAALLRDAVAVAAHVAHDLQAQALGLGGLAGHGAGRSGPPGTRPGR